MSDITTLQIFSNGEQGITATKMNNIIGQASVQTDFVATKPVASSVAANDQLLLLTTGGTYARTNFSTVTNTVSGSLVPAGVGQAGIVNALSGDAGQYIGGDNACHTLPPPLLATTSAIGAVPALPASGTAIGQQQRTWARGDNTWQSLPLQNYSGFITYPVNQIYTIDLSVAPTLGYRIVQLNAITTSGTCNVQIYRNGTGLGSPMGVGSGSQSIASLNVDVAQNDKIDLNVTAISGALNLAFSMRFQL